MLDLRYKWKPFLNYGQMIEFEKNKIIYRQGETGKGIYYLCKGEVKITLLSDRGDERIINIVPPGMLFGEHGIHNEHYLTGAYTCRQSMIYHFSDEVLSMICKEHPEASMIFTNSLIYKFRILAEIISYLDCPVEQQMAYYLVKLYQENGNVPMNQTSFAKYIGTSRLTVNKVIQKWKQEDYIDLNSRQIIIKDMNRMKAIAHNLAEA
ncbi:Crp/Fnr family transcriptional regulator [Peribacillus alkalitolerans]|uniref:Crp/Fnr family transcriptional regulator n=1 Tax=Peribacillus alkalitolerans TaxID=1550385 RepID=UPI0013D28BA0|nr:Crp/Fnr family transcriptional regulator [Peribacillus alkalitolerans]